MDLLLFFLPVLSFFMFSSGQRCASKISASKKKKKIKKFGVSNGFNRKSCDVQMLDVDGRQT
jgi:predicted PurR-regulated permease PerM